MPEHAVKILLIEDNRAEARLLREVLGTTEPMEFSIVHVQHLREGLKQLAAESFDIILLDLTLPDSAGLESLSTLVPCAPTVPIVVLTNTNDEQLALEALRQGAQDYLVKRLVNMERLGRSLHYAIERKQISLALLKANEELAETNARLKEEIREREKVQAELERSNQELEQFAYIASHDLKQPLSSISSWAQMLAMRSRGNLDEKADQCINYILDGTGRMQQLIEDLLTYSRAGRMTESFEATSCEQLVKEAMASLENAISQSEARITCDRLPTVMADPVQLEQLFQNLLDNALKYCQHRTPQIHISAMLQPAPSSDSKSQAKNGDRSADGPDESEWVFSVKDNGIGINREHFDRIFMIFQRLHRRDEYPGTGIGLATCQKIVEYHGGRIWVESEVGCGSTFYFTLPAQRSESNSEKQ